MTPAQPAAAPAATTSPVTTAGLAQATQSAPPVTPPVTPPVSPHAPAAPPPAPVPPAPASAAAQLGASFAVLSAPSQPGTATLQTPAQHLVIRLDPAELGQVQVSIERPPGGGAHVTLAVERSDTMMLLQQDRPQLNQALDAAGIPAEGRTLQFTLSADAGAGNGNQGGDAPGSMGGGGNQGGSRNQPSPYAAARTDDATQSARPARHRAGIDITA